MRGHIHYLLLPYVKLVMLENIPQKLVLFQIVFAKIAVKVNILQRLAWTHVQIVAQENTPRKLVLIIQMSAYPVLQANLPQKLLLLQLPFVQIVQPAFIPTMVLLLALFVQQVQQQNHKLIHTM